MSIFVKSNKIHILLLSLLALVLLSACHNPAPASNIPKEPLGPPDRVDVVYFYDAKACACNAAMAAQIQTTLFLNFNKELTSGKLTLQCVDVNTENNTAIINKYGATGTTSSLFINVIRGNTEHIVPVPEIFLVKDNEEALDELVNTRIRGYLGGEE